MDPTGVLALEEVRGESFSDNDARREPFPGSLLDDGQGGGTAGGANQEGVSRF